MVLADNLNRIFSRAIVVVCCVAAAASITLRGREALAAEGKMSYEIKVITFNVCALPDYITSKRNLAPMETRLRLIGENLKGYDIIGLQEMFVKQREIIEVQLGEYFVVSGADTRAVQKMGTGVFIFSRWPISRSLYEEWKVSAGPDTMSQKGFVLATTHVGPGLDLDVINLHGQAGKKYNDIKELDYDQLMQGVEYFSRVQGRPILAMGDYNCKFGSEQCDHLLEISGFKAVDPEQKGVDHIFYDENGSGWKITVVDFKKAFDYEIEGERISDHEAFETTLRFEKEEETESPD